MSVVLEEKKNDKFIHLKFEFKIIHLSFGAYIKSGFGDQKLSELLPSYRRGGSISCMQKQKLHHESQCFSCSC